MLQSRPRRPATTPLRGYLLVRNPLWNAWLRVNDFALGVLYGTAGGAPVDVAPPRRVLVAIGGHLGDAVIASAFLSKLPRIFPGVEIGVLSGSWNVRVFDSLASVKWIHTVDHWKLNRANASLFTRWRRARRDGRRAIEEMRSVGYDAAIDLAVYYPNCVRLLWRAGIPVRIGYSSGGDSPLFTHGVPWSPRTHIADEHTALLDQLVPSLVPAPARYELAALSGDVVARVHEKLRAAAVEPGTYVVVHMGAGHPRKEWSDDRWIAVVRELAALGVRCVLTGAGEAEAARARRVAAAVPGTVSFSDQLDWTEFRALIASARVVLCVDTVAMHLAAEAGRPCVALMTGIDRAERWRPPGSRTDVLTEPVPCAPCFRSRGCSTMSCIRDVTVETVLTATREHLRSSPTTP